MSVNTYAAITAEQKTFYQKALIQRLLPALHAYEDAQKSTLPHNSGLTVNWRKFESLPITETELTEGVTPAGKNLSVTAITAEAKQYGDFVVISDILAKAGIDKAMTEGALLCGEQAALLIDTVILNAMSSGATAKDFSSSELTDEVVQEIVLELKRKNARRFPDGYYHALISPAQAYSLMKIGEDKGWTAAAKYGSIKKLLKGEVGELHGVRFRESTNIPETACYIYGADSYGVVDMEGGAGKPGIITKGFGSAGVEDPLDQRATVGWKNLFVAKVLNKDAIYKVTTKAVE
jgi:N4-gp56 family major capsid protein